MKTLSIDNSVNECYSVFKLKLKESRMIMLDWLIILGLAVAYIVGTMFGYIVAIQQGRRAGIERSLDTLIALGYVRTGVNAQGETVIYKYWEKEKSND
jgi:hypothetical protein